MTKKYKMFAINPGSTSTKVSLFEDQQIIFSMNVAHDAQELKKFGEISDQLPYRKETILDALEEARVSLGDVDAFVGRGGAGCVSMPGGTYTVNDLMMAHCRAGFNAKHASNLGCLLAYDFSRLSGGAPVFVVNPVGVDEFEEVARVTGLAAVHRKSLFHVLNQKETARRCAEAIGKEYDQINLIVVHMGGGISVAAHKNGRMIDSNNAISGDGPMAPTRSGQVPLLDVINLCFSGKYTQQEMQNLVTQAGGLTNHLGTTDILEIKQRIQSGDPYAALVYEAMIYQIGKSIGSCAVVLRGRVDAIALTGGIANDKDLVDELTDMIQFIAPVKLYPGEFEMEAMASGAIRVLTGKELPREYTGVPVWDGFNKG